MASPWRATSSGSSRCERLKNVFPRWFSCSVALSQKDVWERVGGREVSGRAPGGVGRSPAASDVPHLDDELGALARKQRGMHICIGQQKARVKRGDKGRRVEFREQHALWWVRALRL